MNRTITIALTLNGDWIVTIDNPYEAGWETELARFNTSATTPDTSARRILERAAASVGVVTAAAFSGTVRVQGHDAEAVDLMRRYVARKAEGDGIADLFSLEVHQGT